MTDDLLGRLRGLEPRYLWVAYHNYSGLAHAKVVPESRFEQALKDGVSFAKANWDFTITDDQLPHAGFAADSGDFWLIPDPEFVIGLSHRPHVAMALGTLVDEAGQVWVGDPRDRLRLQSERLREHGYSALLGFEAEFTLVQASTDGSFGGADEGRMFVLDEVDARWDWCERVLRTCEDAGLSVHQFAKEYGPAQYELSLQPADPVAAVDSYLTARQVVKSLARDEGLIATFMPKPWSDRPSNGLHVHLSLTDERGREALPEAADVRALSSIGGSCVAGILAHADGLAALAAPTVNSYRRLVPGSWAPAHKCWAFGNRAALVRVPGTGTHRHIEYRMGDATANPYLLATGLLAGAADGMEAAMQPPPEVPVDVGHVDDVEAAALGAERLPADPPSAIDALTKDPTLLDALGPVIAEHYVAVKRYEFELYQGARPEQVDVGVTDWERRAYLGPV